MMRRLAKYLVGKRQEGEVGYYKRLFHVERKLKELAATTVIVLVWIIAIITIFTFDTPDSGYYAPDYVNAEGALIDIDGDGDFYHWVEK